MATVGRPIITWADVRWTLFIVAGLAFLYLVALVAGWSATLPAPWGGIVWGIAATIIVLLIALELRRFWLDYRQR
jgi:hypothetical protein